MILTLTVFLLGFFSAIFYVAVDDTINPEAIASLEITNSTSQNIEEVSISITDGSGKIYSKISYYEFHKNKTLVLPMYFERDGSYIVTYTLEDGTVFTSKHGYVMRGDISSEVITNSGIN